MALFPRRGRVPFDSSFVSKQDLNEMEDRIMAALEEVIAQLKDAVEDANTRFQNVGQLETALAEERRRYAELVASEKAEDVEQNEQLQAARQATDDALAELNEAANTLSGITEQVNTLGQQASEQSAEPSAPASSAPSEEEAPAATTDQVSDEAPAETATGDATDTASATGDETATNDGPDEAPGTSPDATGPTDADGNPVSTPNL